MTEHNRPVELPDGDAVDDLLAQEDVVLLELWTVGCGICASMDPVLDVVAKQTDAVVATLNPGNDVELIESFDVTSVPALILYVDGEEVDRKMEGFVGADDILDMIDAHTSDVVPTEAR